MKDILHLLVGFCFGTTQHIDSNILMLMYR